MTLDEETGVSWVWRSYADELAVATFIGIPVCLGIAWVFHRWRGASETRNEGARSILLNGLILASVLPFLYATLSRGYGIQSTISLVPFREIFVSFSSPQVALSDVTLLNLGGNAALLLPFGALIPMRCKRFARTGRVAALAGLLSVSVEIAQYVLSVGRVSSVDDVLLNTVGAVVGALLTRRWWRPRDTDRMVLAATSRPVVRRHG
ncbi:VanZ family protein [Streptomyces sp. GMY02]|uniref:VanZ family protein n=1 Tax=Streptomyces sp. GMY02 TaxID=1333528 RepID=UPI001C2C7434|nr:VanZ family protein [Streptomyces sp. GMY02]QXE38049.1 VanZ family protein [Streptomyces sp. GMY02]